MKMFQKVVFILVLCMCFSVIGFSQAKKTTPKKPKQSQQNPQGSRSKNKSNQSQQGSKKKTAKKKNTLTVREESLAFELVLIA